MFEPPTPQAGLYQRRFGGPDTPPLTQGDCWATVVIGFAGLTEPDRNELHRRIVLSDCALLRQGKNPQKDGAWWEVTERFLRQHQCPYISVVPKTDEGQPDRVYIVSGPSPRIEGASHSILAYGDGRLFSDPHPDGTGLDEIDEWISWWKPK